MNKHFLRHRFGIGLIFLALLLVSLVILGVVYKAQQGEANLAVKTQGVMGMVKEPNAAPQSLSALSPQGSDEVIQEKREVVLSDNSNSASFQNSSSCTIHHIVRVGESLATIALSYNVSLSALVKANGIGNSGLINVGQMLCIPGPLATPTPTAVATNPAQTAVATSPAQTAPPPGSTVENYTVRSGDTLSAIALTFGVSLDALMEINGITDARTLQVGQELQIPGSGTIVLPTSAPVAVSPVVVSTPAPAGHLFKVQFFNNMTLSGSPVFVKTDSVGWSYDWGLNAPAPGVNRDFFSASWDGSFTFPAGNNRFTVAADDGTRLYVDGVLVLNNWFDQPDHFVYTTEVFLTAGVHHVRLEYYERGDKASARMNWEFLSADVPGIESGQELVAQPTLSPDLKSYSGQEGEETVWEALRTQDAASLRNVLQSLPELNFTRDDGWTPLHAAINTDQADLIAAVLEHPTANIEVGITSGIVRKVTPLHFAVIHGTGGRLTAIRTLLQHGADIEARDSLGNTPLLSAASRLIDESFELLLAQGANPDVQTESSGNRSGWTPLHYAAIRSQDLQPLRLLLAHPQLDPNIRSDERITALYQVVVNNDLEKARILLRHPDINPNRDTRNGITPLHYAAINGYFEMAHVLLNHRDIDPNSTTDKLGWTPLHYAVWNDNAFVVEALVDHTDTDINAEADDEGRSTPCRLAAYLENDYLLYHLQQDGGRRCSGYD